MKNDGNICEAYRCKRPMSLTYNGRKICQYHMKYVSEGQTAAEDTAREKELFGGIE